jgi:hypothetical protein
VVAGGPPRRALASCQIGGGADLLLALLGLLTPSGFGLVPLGGHDIWLHAVIGGILTAVGLLGPNRAVTRA